jgi:hypothetical protein
MKKIMLMFALAASVLAANSKALAYSSVDENSSWRTIWRSAIHRVDAPKIVFGNNHVSIFSVCVDDDAQVARANVDVCVETKQTADESYCVRTAKRTVSKPLEYSGRYCVETKGDGVCTRYSTYQSEIERTYMVPVYDLSNGEERAEFNLAFKKRYDLPSCN